MTSPAVKREAQFRQIRKECYDNLILFGSYFISDFQKDRTPDFHFEVAKDLLDYDLEGVVNVIPRGYSKSTLTRTGLLHAFCYSHVDKKNWGLLPPKHPDVENEFAGWVAESGDQTKDNISDISEDLENNQFLINVFGDQYANHHTWNKNEITTPWGDRLIGRGVNQKLRGRHEGGLRFTIMVLDDVESLLNTKTPEARKQIRTWIMATPLQALARHRKRVWINGTIVHSDSFLQRLVNGYKDSKKHGKDFSYKVNFFRATHDGQLTDDSKLLWPERFPLSWLRQKRQTLVDAGTPSLFAQEYMNDARADEDIIIKDEDIILREYKFLRNQYGDAFIYDNEEYLPCHVYFGVDPAASVSAGRSYSVIIPIAIVPGFTTYVLPYFHDRVLPMDHAEKIFEYYDYYKPKLINIEPIGYQISLQDYLSREMRNRGVFLPGVGPQRKIKVGRMQDKHDRAAGRLQPMFSNKAIIMQPHMDELIGELAAWSDPFDLVDGLYYAFEAARPPKDRQVQLDNAQRPLLEKPQDNKVRYNWMTGTRIPA